MLRQRSSSLNHPAEGAERAEEHLPVGARSFEELLIQFVRRELTTLTQSQGVRVDASSAVQGGAVGWTPLVQCRVAQSGGRL
ncbi:hypothetical protein NDU88_006979 [Pleurodeles waltl]|uniref:Uncharacterized protein n=1 Tax=Pleurodeles waltl TaxID=8319 RepID=A0AAV7MDS6_PLEWA|nr:hypothetical protein NDU88_006979 [Pleurodeles waltl]